MLGSCCRDNIREHVVRHPWVGWLSRQGSRSMKSKMLAVGKRLLLFATLYTLFRYAGDFSTSQSVVLTVVSWLGYGPYEELSLSRKTEDVFTPFSVSVYPNWYVLLLDFKLIRSEEDWGRLCDAADKLPASTFSVFRRGFLFTVIKPPSPESLPPGLAF
jgi:hypothetical protein